MREIWAWDDKNQIWQLVGTSAGGIDATIDYWLAKGFEDVTYFITRSTKRQRDKAELLWKKAIQRICSLS